MSDLTQFRDHCRRMQTAVHRLDCAGRGRRERSGVRCPGCVTDADRALWKRLADEVDSYAGA